MKTIGKSLVLVILVAIFLTSMLTIVGLILNFWNETLINCLVGFLASVTIGTITYFGITSALDTWTGDKLPF